MIFPLFWWSRTEPAVFPRYVTITYKNYVVISTYWTLLASCVLVHLVYVRQLDVFTEDFIVFISVVKGQGDKPNLITSCLIVLDFTIIYPLEVMYTCVVCE